MCVQKMMLFLCLGGSLFITTGCGSGYMLYNTRFIPTSGTNFGPESAELPWKPPFIEGQPYEHTPSRGETAITRYQTTPLMGVDRNIWDKHFDGDDSGSGRLDRQRAENTESTLPPATVKSLRNYTE